MDNLFVLLHLILVIRCGLVVTCHAAGVVGRLTPADSLTDGMTLVSGNGTFEAGFFSPGTSTGHYLGIWYRNIPVRTVVWVANRANPINDSSGSLNVDESGNLLLLSNGTVVWSANSTAIPQSSILQLLDTGNLVVTDGGNDSSPDSYLWQSFDYPTDTFIPEMKIGWDLRRGLNRGLSAWKNGNDPSPGDFTWGMNHLTYPEAIAWKGNQKYFRSGPWNGLRFSGAPEQRTNQIFWFNFVDTQDEVYYSYHLLDKSVLTRTILNQSNNYARERYTWSEATRTWQLYSTVPKDYCDDYGLCGPNGNCDMNTMPVCQCLKGFSPVTPVKWNSMDWTQGCKRNAPLGCDGRDGFVRFTGLKLPDTAYTWVDRSMELKECKDKCLKNCSCTAYTHADIRGSGSGCVMWFGDLVDIRHYPDGGQDLFVRMPNSELDGNGADRVKIIVAAVISVVGVTVLLIAAYNVRRLRKNHRERTEYVGQTLEKNGSSKQQDMELPLFDHAAISMATNDFSIDNKLGEGGFGPVYKGTLPDGQEIAVKRLSSSSGQGPKEFKNEVIFIAKLQHRNLVRLLGCCIERDEKMLIYEYMPNRSLDAFIFDSKRGYLLDWNKRFNIICGVARGLLYLHQDSRLRIIHRDLKASNVLLDKEMNPRISDFGMARTFGGDQSEGNTNRVVGTYGYMAPEYAIDGLFSVKSDVFSFGILILEIISGKRSRGIFHSNQNLIGHAWRFFAEGKPLELTDPSLEALCNVSEVIRCIHVSFLCLQHHPEDRPSMASVVVMLGSEGALPPPKQPGFLIDRRAFDASTSLSKPGYSVNEITVTMEARLTAITQLVHHGMILVPIGYTFGAGMFEMETVKGGSTYSAGTYAGDGSRQPTELELGQAFHPGKYIARMTKKLKGAG